MRIVYLHQYFVTPQMSGGTRSYEMARRLVARGNKVTMITADPKPSPGSCGKWRRENIDGIEVLWLGVPYDNSFSVLARLKAFASFAFRASWKALRTPGDVVFATSTPLTIAIPGIIGSVFRRRPMVFEVRDLWPDVPIALGFLTNPVMIWLARGMEWLAYHAAHHVVCLAPGMREHVVTRGIPTKRTSVIPNGCDMDEFRHSDDLREEGRSELGFSEEHKVVVFTGTLGKANGIDYLVDIASHAVGLMEQIRFVIIGDGAMRAPAEELARKHGLLGEHVYFLGKRPKHEMPKWLGAAEITLALFKGPKILWKDAVQNKFFDSLAAGRPVASNFDGWQSRIAEEYKIGITIDQDDAKAAAEKLVAALVDDLWLENACATARTVGANRFARDAQAEELSIVLQRVAGISE